MIFSTIKATDTEMLLNIQSNVIRGYVPNWVRNDCHATYIMLMLSIRNGLITNNKTCSAIL